MPKPIPIVAISAEAHLKLRSYTRIDAPKLATYLKVLGELHRLRIFRVLLESELCVCELEEQLGVSPSLLAHRLRMLKDSGLNLVRRGIRDARWLYYFIHPAALAVLQAMLSNELPYRDLPPEAHWSILSLCTTFATRPDIGADSRHGRWSSSYVTGHPHC
jgi:DNA-binding transcriptional ArsR family regulator